MPSISTKLGAVCVLVLAAGWLLFVLLVKPGDHPSWFACPFLRFTGLYCPGCGSTRSSRHLLHGEILQSIRFNVLVIVLALPAFVVAIGSSLRVLASRPTASFRLPGVTGWAVLTVVLGFWFVRNLPAEQLDVFRPPKVDKPALANSDRLLSTKEINEHD